jgi:hypothetical protein
VAFVAFALSATAQAQPNLFVSRRVVEQGANSIPFTGTLDKRTFESNRYQVIARATDSAGQKSQRVKAKFTIVG